MAKKKVAKRKATKTATPKKKAVTKSVGKKKAAIKRTPKSAKKKTSPAKSTVVHPLFNPPTNTPMKSLGAVSQAKCSLRHPGCIANPVGPTKAYRDQNTKAQVNCCVRCHDQMVRAGQWVDVP